MNRKVLMFDCDGVLCDFVLGFTTLANRLFGTKIVTTLEQPSWNFRTWGLLTREQEEATWATVRRSSVWWESLEPLVSAETLSRIYRLQWKNEVVFCTNRVSDVVPPGEQTKRWLEFNGILRPSVIVSGKKGEIARAIGATHSIDDKIENAWAIHWMSDCPQTASFILDRPYNQIQSTPEVGPARVRRVATVDEFIDEVEKEKE